LQSDPTYIKAIIKKIALSEKDVSLAAEQIYHRISGEVMGMFREVYDRSEGQSGFVTVQEDPRWEENIDYIVEASMRSSNLNKNYMAKIPVTKSGLIAIEEMVRLDIPICATEIFSLAQTLAVCEVYEKASRKYKKSPILFITHITGIMDQYFHEIVQRESIMISPEALAMAGTAIALMEYKMLKEKKLPHKMLGGGARGLQHFTNFVGGDLHITINWSTALDLNKTYSEPIQVIDQEVPERLISELINKLPNFSRAYYEDGMKVNEFADYGPVMLFRTQFMNGYSRLIDEVQIALNS
jgi:transaldolase